MGLVEITDQFGEVNKMRDTYNGFHIGQCFIKIRDQNSIMHVNQYVLYTCMCMGIWLLQDFFLHALYFPTLNSNVPHFCNFIPHFVGLVQVALECPSYNFYALLEYRFLIFKLLVAPYEAPQK